MDDVQKKQLRVIFIFVLMASSFMFGTCVEKRQNEYMIDNLELHCEEPNYNQG